MIYKRRPELSERQSRCESQDMTVKKHVNQEVRFGQHQGLVPMLGPNRESGPRRGRLND